MMELSVVCITSGMSKKTRYCVYQFMFFTPEFAHWKTKMVCLFTLTYLHRDNKLLLLIWHAKVR